MAFSLANDHFLKALSEDPNSFVLANVFEPALAIAEACHDTTSEQRNQIVFRNWAVVTGTLKELNRIGFAAMGDMKVILEYFERLDAKCRVDCITIPDVVNFLLQRADDIRRAAWAGWKAAAHGGSIPAPVPEPVLRLSRGTPSGESVAIDLAIRENAEEKHPEAPAQNLERFTGGKMVFFEDRVELCGVDICSGPQSERQRKALDLLRLRRDDGQFASYSGQEIAEKLGLETGQKGAGGLIRDIRRRIRNALRNQANIECSDEDVIISGGPGYRFSEKLSVHHGHIERDSLDQVHGRGIQTGDEPNDPNRDEPDDTNDPNHDDPDGTNDPVHDDPNVLDDQAQARRNWILQKLAKQCDVRALDIVEQFKCSPTTAKRDLKSLKDDGEIEFIGTTRKGNYVLKKRAKPR